MFLIKFLVLFVLIKKHFLKRFEDESGLVVESLEEEIVSTDNNTSLSNTTKSLTLNWDTSLAGKSYYCVINHASVPEPMKRELVSDINVLCKYALWTNFEYKLIYKN